MMKNQEGTRVFVVVLRRCRIKTCLGDRATNKKWNEHHVLLLLLLLFLLLLLLHSFVVFECCELWMAGVLGVSWVEARTTVAKRLVVYVCGVVCRVVPRGALSSCRVRLVLYSGLLDSLLPQVNQCLILSLQRCRRFSCSVFIFSRVSLASGVVMACGFGVHCTK